MTHGHLMRAPVGRPQRAQCLVLRIVAGSDNVYHFTLEVGRHQATLCLAVNRLHAAKDHAAAHALTLFDRWREWKRRGHGRIHAWHYEL